MLERASETIVGVYEQYDGLGFVRPFDDRFPDIFIDIRIPVAVKAKDGDAVVVRLTTYPSKLEAASGYIEEILGHESDAGINIEVIIRRHKIETVFSAEALKEATELTVSKDRFRRDIRDRFVFTIDPKDAKDFDDAISIDFIDGQLRLGVHIADVSAYVAWDSALDLNARMRSTSTYLPDRVISMLPHQLSDELCSLRPNEDKLAFSIDMMMNTDGSVSDVEFFTSVIRSSARLTYEQVQDVLDAGSKQSSVEKDLADKLIVFNKLAKKLHRRRLARGAIDFESVEAKVELDACGKPIEVYLREKTDATSMIEEAMVLANEQVSAYMLRDDAVMVYRVHEEPLPLSLEEVLPTLREFGYASDIAPQTSTQIQEILDKSKDRPEYHLVSTLLLRAMKRAKYTTDYTVHFGMASSGYTHFTSPIRRYPDLMAHRLLKYKLYNEAIPKNMKRLLDGICKHASQRECESDMASYEATALKLCEYLEPYLGEQFEGIVVAVNSYGLAVRENTTTAEGYVSCEDLGEDFVYEVERYRYHDPDSDKSYRLGQPIYVKLIGVDYRNLRLKFVVA